MQKEVLLALEFEYVNDRDIAQVQRLLYFSPCASFFFILPPALTRALEDF
jgi:hypothetical protein